MANKVKLSIAFLLISASAAFAFQGPRPPHGGMGGGHFGPGMGFGPGGKLVTGAPYSADVSSQSVETLADGNTISRTTTGHVARDSQGRTYSQETISGGFMGSKGPMTVIFISDPVAGYSYILNPTTKVANRMAKHTPPQGAGEHKGRGPGSDSPNMTTADLGTQTIGGVTAQGKSITHTIPAGAMGNAQPMVSTGETWYSPDLQLIVLAKHTDARTGQSTYALLNIQKGDPPATLFQVPSDYTIQDGRPAGPGGPPQQ